MEDSTCRNNLGNNLPPVEAIMRFVSGFGQLRSRDECYGGRPIDTSSSVSRLIATWGRFEHLVLTWLRAKENQWPLPVQCFHSNTDSEKKYQTVNRRCQGVLPVADGCQQTPPWVEKLRCQFRTIIQFPVLLLHIIEFS